MINYIFMLSCGDHFQPIRSSSSYLPGFTSKYEREGGGECSDSWQLSQLACRHSEVNTLLTAADCSGLQQPGRQTGITPRQIGEIFN